MLKPVHIPCMHFGKAIHWCCRVQARGNVETWLSQVEQSMAVCLRKLARAGHQTYPTQARTQWVMQQPSQLVLLISQVHFLCISKPDVSNAPRCHNIMQPGQYRHQRRLERVHMHFAGHTSLSICCSSTDGACPDEQLTLLQTSLSVAAFS